MMTPTLPPTAQPAPPAAPAPRARRWRNALVLGMVALVLAAVFASWLNPHLMVALLNPIWSCF